METRCVREGPCRRWGDVTINVICGMAQGCSGPFGTADAAPRLVQAIQATGGAGVLICDQDWMPVLSQLPALQSYDPGFYPLSQPAMPLTIDVYVDDVLQKQGWSYDAKENAVVFDVQFIPGAEVEVKVLYVVTAATC